MERQELVYCANPVNEAQPISLLPPKYAISTGGLELPRLRWKCWRLSHDSFALLGSRGRVLFCSVELQNQTYKAVHFPL